jgi:hypothetical protein
MRSVAFALFLAACGSEPSAPVCPTLPAECTPQYEPNFDEVFSNTLQRSCGVGGGSCHAAAGAKGGLALDDADTAHAQLLSNARVIPGDASCSTLIQRMDHAEPARVMPPGAKLSANEICAVRRWIEAGALR